MKRVIAPIAAVLLVLAIAGPVAADPGNPQSQLYVVTCSGASTTLNVSSRVPAWDVNWAPGDTPWLLMSYTVTVDGEAVFTEFAPRGLEGNRKLIGPCTIDGAGFSLTNAYFLRR